MDVASWMDESEKLVFEFGMSAGPNIVNVATRLALMYTGKRPGALCGGNRRALLKSPFTSPTASRQPSDASTTTPTTLTVVVVEYPFAYSRPNLRGTVPVSVTAHTHDEYNSMAYDVSLPLVYI